MHTVRHISAVLRVRAAGPGERNARPDKTASRQSTGGTGPNQHRMATLAGRPRRRSRAPTSRYDQGTRAAPDPGGAAAGTLPRTIRMVVETEDKFGKRSAGALHGDRIRIVALGKIWKNRGRRGAAPSVWTWYALARGSQNVDAPGV